MQIGFHHYQKHKKTSTNLSHGQKKLNGLMDKLIYIFGTVGVLIFIPQMVSVWSERNISGVSLISWVGMCVASTFWLIYGIIHKAWPIVYANALAGVVQLLVIIGILVHQ